MRFHSSCLFSHWSVAVGGLWLVLSHSSCLFSHWSVAVGGLWLVLSHSSCLFSHWSVAVGGLWLVRFHSSCLFHTGRSLLVDFGLCASTRLVFFTLVGCCWWTLACALPLVLSFSRFLERSNEVMPFHPTSRLKPSGRKFVHAAGKTREKPRKSASSANFQGKL